MPYIDPIILMHINRTYAKTKLGLDLLDAKRFMKAAIALIDVSDTDTKIAKPAQIQKVIRIVLSEEEEKAIEAIQQRQSEIEKK